MTRRSFRSGAALLALAVAFPGVALAQGTVIETIDAPVIGPQVIRPPVQPSINQTAELAPLLRSDVIGPALAPTTRPNANERVGDGTDPSSLSPVAKRPGSIRINGAATQPGAAATILADNLALSGDNSITASGGVVVWYQGTRLVASQVRYDQNSGGVTLQGPIHLTEPGQHGTEDETILIADEAQLDPNMKDGIIRGARLVMARELQLAASEVRRTNNGRFTILDRVVASSCQVCAANPVPLWEIRARQVSHDTLTQQLHFDNPQFRAFGVPIFALPAMTAPDPTVDRMTGFLRPQFRTTSQLGFGIKIPYFITLGDSADLTLTPYLSTSRTRTLEYRYRQAFANGVVELNGAVSRDDIRQGQTRDYLFGAGQFMLPNDYRLTFQVQQASDRSYLLDYDITDADRLWSGVILDRVKRNSFVYTRLGKYESLREDEDPATVPAHVLDGIWHRRWQPSGIGGEAGLEWSVHAHRRPSNDDIIGRDAFRGSLGFDWRRSEILPHGFVAAIQTRIDADIYNIRQDSRFDDWFTRMDPIIAAELRWPLIRAAGAVTHILEPVIQVVWSPDRDWGDDTPNEDSTLVEFDEGNLFSLNRFPGSDARETGLRANVGMTWTRIDPAGWELAMTAGRVFRSDRDPALRDSSTFSGKNSDWLLAAHYSNNDGLAIANRTLFDDSLNISRNELRLGWLKPGLQLSAGYLWMDADQFENRDDDVSELTTTAGFQIAEGWWGSTEIRYDFSADRAQKAEVGLEYRNDCVSVEMGLQRRFTSSFDVKPETTFDLGVRLTGFGAQNDLRGTVARRTCLR